MGGGSEWVRKWGRAEAREKGGGAGQELPSSCPQLNAGEAQGKRRGGKRPSMMSMVCDGFLRDGLARQGELEAKCLLLLLLLLLIC